MKTFIFAALIALAATGMASAQMGNPLARMEEHKGSCVNNNSKHCQEARAAFAEHHNGMSPEQWDNQNYQGHKGRWVQNGKNWQYEGSNGEQYRKVHDKWQWAQEKAHRDHDHN